MSSPRLSDLIQDWLEGHVLGRLFSVGSNPSYMANQPADPVGRRRSIYLRRNFTPEPPLPLTRLARIQDDCVEFLEDDAYGMKELTDGLAKQIQEEIDKEIVLDVTKHRDNPAIEISHTQNPFPNIQITAVQISPSKRKLKSTWTVDLGFGTRVAHRFYAYDPKFFRQLEHQLIRVKVREEAHLVSRVWIWE